MLIKIYQIDGIMMIFDSDVVWGGICVGQYVVFVGMLFSKSFFLFQGVMLWVLVCLVYWNKYGSGLWILMVNNVGVLSVLVMFVFYD